MADEERPSNHVEDFGWQEIVPGLYTAPLDTMPPTPEVTTVTVTGQFRQCWTCRAPMVTPNVPEGWTVEFWRESSVTMVTPHRPNCSGRP